MLLCVGLNSSHISNTKLQGVVVSSLRPSYILYLESQLSFATPATSTVAYTIEFCKVPSAGHSMRSLAYRVAMAVIENRSDVSARVMQGKPGFKIVLRCHEALFQLR